jgi:hypothetical protein
VIEAKAQLADEYDAAQRGAPARPGDAHLGSVASAYLSPRPMSAAPTSGYE